MEPINISVQPLNVLVSLYAVGTDVCSYNGCTLCLHIGTPKDVSICIKSALNVSMIPGLSP